MILKLKVHKYQNGHDLSLTQDPIRDLSDLYLLLISTMTYTKIITSKILQKSSQIVILKSKRSA